MNLKQAEAQIGYSIFETYEGCYQYNEDACFIADTRETAELFMHSAGGRAEECRIDAITFGDIMEDYGGSCGEYAMESGALTRFKRVAELNRTRFRVEPYDGDDTLAVVSIAGVRRNDE